MRIVIKVFVLIVSSSFIVRALCAQPEPDTENKDLTYLIDTYLTTCTSLGTDINRIRHRVRTTTFTDAADIDRTISAIQDIQEYLERELAQCADYAALSAQLNGTLNLLQFAKSSTTVTHRSRTIHFHFEGITPFYQEIVRNQILAELITVETLFERELKMDPGNASIVFLITDRRIMEKDIGGAAIGSFIWLPLEYALGQGHRWAEGVRESTVRHEIVHVLMNQTSLHPQRHTYPRPFVEGMALYLAGNRVIEYNSNSNVRLSEDYIDFLRAFDFLEEQAGRNAVFAFIHRMLMGEEDDFFEAYERIGGLSYADVVGSAPSLFEKTTRILQRDLQIPRSWHPSLFVFGFLICVVIGFTLRIAPHRVDEVRRNISMGFLAFIIIALLTGGRLIDMAYDNYIVFILLTLFVSLLLRGYPILRDEQILEAHTEDVKHMQEKKDPDNTDDFEQHQPM